jgi:hypothetical protein
MAHGKFLAFRWSPRSDPGLPSKSAARGIPVRGNRASCRRRQFSLSLNSYGHSYSYIEPSLFPCVKIRSPSMPRVLFVGIALGGLIAGFMIGASSSPVVAAVIPALLSGIVSALALIFKSPSTVPQSRNLPNILGLILIARPRTVILTARKSACSAMRRKEPLNVRSRIDYSTVCRPFRARAKLDRTGFTNRNPAIHRLVRQETFRYAFSFRFFTLEQQ